MMHRRSFLRLGALAANAAPLPFQAENSKLKITACAWSTPGPSGRCRVPAGGGLVVTSGVEVANPMSIYPEYKPTRSLFMPTPESWMASPSRSPPTRV